jgi:hypothetical protein
MQASGFDTASAYPVRRAVVDCPGISGQHVDKTNFVRRLGL